MITLREIIQNIGKGQSGIAVKYILQELSRNYETIKDRIKITNTKIMDGGTQIYSLIPSSDKPIKYDVVFWLDTDSKLTLDTKIKCYSNSPSFAYNFAYLFNQQSSLLFPEKYPNSFITMPPKMRNPYGTYGFDKHVFSCIKHIGSKKISDLIDQFQNIPVNNPVNFATKQNELNLL